MSLADPQWAFLLRLGIAAVLGLIVGAEREARDKAAGLRTQSMVCAGAAAFALVSAYGFASLPPASHVDTSRVAAQVATGVGFLGAGAIIVSRERVVGLTTAATIWLMAAVGLLSGTGLYILAVGATILGLFLLEVINYSPLKRLLHRETLIRLVLRPQPDMLELLEQFATSAGCSVSEFCLSKEEDNRRKVLLRIEGAPPFSRFVDKLETLPWVERIDIAKDQV
jgi:putative Mg2+ transporter-C (MgtC) family protein